jgi:hypothetical protein
MIQADQQRSHYCNGPFRGGGFQGFANLNLRIVNVRKRLPEIAHVEPFPHAGHRDLVRVSVAAEYERGRQLRWPYLGGCSSPMNQPTASDFIGSSDGMAICST